ncbi:hypothetical protein J6590_071319 [Homalodisca vitripennis]|nr:hypothetical protein J6590_071319 [Homalodisca vitripennis]
MCERRSTHPWETGLRQARRQGVTDARESPGQRPRGKPGETTATGPLERQCVAQQRVVRWKRSICINCDCCSLSVETDTRSSRLGPHDLWYQTDIITSA